jgi:hypothetical protein
MHVSPGHANHLQASAHGKQEGVGVGVCALVCALVTVRAESIACWLDSLREGDRIESSPATEHDATADISMTDSQYPARGPAKRAPYAGFGRGS